MIALYEIIIIFFQVILFNSHFFSHYWKKTSGLKRSTSLMISFHWFIKNLHFPIKAPNTIDQIISALITVAYDNFRWIHGISSEQESSWEVYPVETSCLSSCYDQISVIRHAFLSSWLQVQSWCHRLNCVLSHLNYLENNSHNKILKQWKLQHSIKFDEMESSFKIILYYCP